jgi:hypothetical protein
MKRYRFELGVLVTVAAAVSACIIALSLKRTREINTVTFQVRVRKSIGPLVLSQSIEPCLIGATPILSQSDASKGEWLLSDMRYWKGAPIIHPAFGFLENTLKEIVEWWAIEKASNLQRDRDRSLIRDILHRHRSFSIEIGDDNQLHIREE